MTGGKVTNAPFLTYWRALTRAWAVLGMAPPSLADAVQSWEAGRAAYREGAALYSGGVNNGR